MDITKVTQAVEELISSASVCLRQSDALMLAQAAEHVARAASELKRLETEVLKEMTVCSIKSKGEPTDRQVDSACATYRHDFGSMPPETKDSIRATARRWGHAWRRELAGELDT